MFPFDDVIMTSHLRLFVFQICNSELHNPQMMVDGSDGTWWQSTSLPNLINLDYAVGNNPASTIELDLQQVSYHREGGTKADVLQTKVLSKFHLMKITVC